MKNQDGWNFGSACYLKFLLVLHDKCNTFSQSEARNFMYIIKVEIIESNALLSYFLNLLESART